MQIGTLVDGRYEVRAVLGEGAMGVVYRVQHTRLQRTFAMKVMSARHELEGELVLRFHREAMAAASVGHPNIVDVTDMGLLEDGTHYIVQEHLRGRHLADSVERDGLFSVARAVHVTRQICLALEAVHRRRIVHRDLKPENVMLVEQGDDPDFVKVLDFGICKLLEPDDGGRLTRTNVTLGTPLFMAPEQFLADASLDARVDIHGVGAILYYLLTEQPLYKGRDFRHLYMRISAEPPPSVRSLRPDVPEALDAVVRRACAKQPDDRFQSCAEMARALAGVDVGRVSTVRRVALDATQGSETELPPVHLAQEATQQGEAASLVSEVSDEPVGPSFLRQAPPPRQIVRTLVVLVAASGLIWWGRALLPPERESRPAVDVSEVPSIPVAEGPTPSPAVPDLEVPPPAVPEPDQASVDTARAASVREKHRRVERGPRSARRAAPEARAREAEAPAATATVPPEPPDPARSDDPEATSTPPAPAHTQVTAEPSSRYRIPTRPLRDVF